MDFWTNKSAARYYDYSGRPYPNSPYPNNRVGQRRSLRSGRLVIHRCPPLSTPVHRFQNNDNSSTAGPSCQATNRAPRPSSRNNNDRTNYSSAASLPLLQSNNISNNTANVGNNQQNISTATNATNRRLLQFSEFNDAVELAGFKLSDYSVCIIFLILTFAIVAVATFYLDYDHETSIQHNYLRVLAFCGLLLILMLLIFSLGSFCPMLCRHVLSRYLQENLTQNSQVLCSNNAGVTDNTRQISIVRQSPPPPYHIAILIPPINSLEDIPPPAYDKIMQ